ncbi:MoaC-domain-containing protein [Wilcoxina mikolae CBS 423.85]|nr:MoaC-domain-containing protein [Wilcoxina mikolae CBS 423.85]
MHLLHSSPRYYSTTSQKLPHLTPSGSAHMVPIHTKPDTTRTAVASGVVTFSNPTALHLIKTNANKKGDVLALARISGIMAAKKCPDLVVLCHPVMLSSVEVDVVASESDSEHDHDDDGMGGTAGGNITITARVTCNGKTGVEMEALTAVMGAALAVVDMCKAVDKGIVVGGVRVTEKRGGRSGDWVVSG